jgi:hypothetical protein
VNKEYSKNGDTDAQLTKLSLQTNKACCCASAIVNTQWPSGLPCYCYKYFGHGTYSVTSLIPGAGDVHVFFFSILLIVEYQTNIYYYYYYGIFGTSLLK